MPDPDVLFLVLDSARRDRVSAYGHDRPTTPTLDTLADEATVFEHAYVPAPWTLPSHCSMFTGLYPSEHGVTSGFTHQGFGLPANVPTLAERLAERGYHTAGFSNNPWVGQLSGLDRGFEEFVEWDLEVSRSANPIHGRRGQLYSKLHTALGHASRQPLVLLKRRFFTERLVSRAAEWLSHTADREAPTFTFLNLMEAHSPYYPPRDAFDALDLNRPSAIEARRLNVKLLTNIMGRARLDWETRERLLEYYDASLRYLDRMVDRLLSTFEQHGIYEDALLIICADHGKTLGEYDRDATPPHYVRDVNTMVPLLIKEPGQTTPKSIERPFELHRLFETVLEGTLDRSLPATPSTALIEDVVPHTGRDVDPSEITHWRMLSDGTHKYVTSVPTQDHTAMSQSTHDRNGHQSHPGSEIDEDRVEPRGKKQEYLLRGTGIDEALVEPESSVLDRFRSLLAERTEQFDTAVAADTADTGRLSGSIEAQLEDLGYLD
ncbi:sulfatase [Halocatena salina]|uniref:Sulfatase n=1 Tax=Halocatena salina TaxID=2934340 RepID=A0A8U0A206_9EURY|nr:sulfatase [Halocatena salina]UPM42896.1 sulfatase [Halocatena salina]